MTRAPMHLTCEYLINPIGIDEPRPRLAWRLGHHCQSAYQVVVDDTWDSGRVASDQSVHVVYDGPVPQPGQRLSWKVRTWDQSGEPSPFSEPAYWEMGLTSNDHWKAKWIGPTHVVEGGANTQCHYLRRTIELPAQVARARLYIAARGVYEATINGVPVSDEVLCGGFTDANKRLQYRTFDLRDHLREGGNTLDVALAGGWYCGWVIKNASPHLFGGRPAVIARLEIDFNDGMCQSIVTDKSWRIRRGPLVEADLYMGETYDAQRQIGQWEQPAVEPIGDVPLVAYRMEPIRRIRQIRPLSVNQVSRGIFIYDMGQNMVGWCRLRVEGPAGTTVQLRHGEMLNANGTLYTENLRKAKATDRYTLAGEDTEQWEPRFTFHGFRYVEVTGYPGTPDLDSITGVVVHSDMAQTGSFQCDHALVNQLQHNIEWSQRGNFIEVPTDCPQRDERQGWTGDAHVFAATGCFNFNVAAFLSKWMIDIEDGQQQDGAFTNTVPNIYGGPPYPGWIEAGVIVPWTLYERFGDQRILERHYDAMARLIEYLRANSENLIRPTYGPGDWLNHNAFAPLDLLASAYFAHSSDLMSRIATVLGKDQDASKYRDLFERIRQAFNDHFVTPDGRIVGDTQTCYVVALQFDLLDEQRRQAAVARLVYDIHEGRSAVWPHPVRDTHLSTGFLGTRDLPHVLTQFGHIDLAYELLLKEDFPSWLFPITHGATTIWERWDGWTPDGGFQTPAMNSFNHYAYGAIGQWLYEVVAGIRPDPKQPGYKHVIIEPRPGPLKHASAKLETMYGTIESAWQVSSGRFELNVTVPNNTRATVRLPDGTVASAGPGRHVYTSE